MAACPNFGLYSKSSSETRALRNSATRGYGILPGVRSGEKNKNLKQQHYQHSTSALVTGSRLGSTSNSGNPTQPSPCDFTAFAEHTAPKNKAVSVPRDRTELKHPKGLIEHGDTPVCSQPSALLSVRTELILLLAAGRVLCFGSGRAER